MTTVLYDHKNKQLAIDSRATVDGMIISDNVDKTIKNDNGLYLLCGDLCDYEKLTKLSHDDKVDVSPDCSAILIKDGKAFSVIVTNEGYCCVTELKYNYSMGSGSRFAIAALDFGDKVEQAIEYTKLKDLYTGGKVQVFNLLE